jgi:hypothetical protein
MDTPTNSEMWEIRECKCFENNPLTAERSITMNLKHGGKREHKGLRNLGFQIGISCYKILIGI